MAPVDRHERRQQRIRGAGASSVLADFGFSIPAAKQASLPPYRTRRTPTPVHKTPRNGSTKRRRSASVRRSNSVKRHVTPSQSTVTPKLGKRKRGSTNAQAGEEDTEADELSPDRDEVRSIEKSRRVAGTVSPIREEIDDVPDELSFLEEGPTSIQKPKVHASTVARGTPAAAAAKPRVSLERAAGKTPIADRIGNMSISSQVAIVRRSKSIEPPPVTPSLLSIRQPRMSSASRFGPEFTTPSAQNGGDSEDELDLSPVNGPTPRTIGQEQSTQSVAQEVEEEELDELSSPAQPVPAQQSSPLHPAKRAKSKSKTSKPLPVHPSTTPVPAKRGRPRRIVIDEEDEVQATPAASNLRRKRPSLNVHDDSKADAEDDGPDEISPEAERVKQRPVKTMRREEEPVLVSSDESDDYEPEQEEPIARTPRPAPKQKSAKPSSGEPPRKRQKYTGPKQAISVMRIKGSTVRGITVADTTRTIVEQNIDHRISRMADKMQNTQDSARRKQLRGEINIALAFKESLNEKLLDLQDANDTLSTSFQKRRLLKNSNVERRRDILALHNSRQDVALEMDDEQAVFDVEKIQMEAKNILSANMFDIQAAIQSGRERARREGREHEGPEVPLIMLLEMVGRDAGSASGGLLAGVRGFNSGLERAAGWLEGRA